MQLTFRQGIARYQTDVYATPTFLQVQGQYVALNVSPDPTVIIFAQKQATYVIDEIRSVPKAWGPFTTGETVYLYWDISMLDASLTRGYTKLPQIVTAVAPMNPAVDQHWFDTTTKIMKVWNGAKWLEKIRVFAATYTRQSVLTPFPLGTQADQRGTFDAGNLILDTYNKPLRQSDGTFLTTAVEVTVINSSANKVKFESEIIYGMANEAIPRMSWVTSMAGGKLAVARSNKWQTRIMGLALEDLYESEVGNIEPCGLVMNEQWNFTASEINRPVFCNEFGEVTLVPPNVGVSQICGYVYSSNAIIVDIQPVVILSIRDAIPGVISFIPQVIAPIASKVGVPVDQVITRVTVSQFTVETTGLPAGLTVSSFGNVLSLKGTPTVAGDYTYTITIKADGYTDATITSTITVAAANLNFTFNPAVIADVAGVVGLAMDMLLCTFVPTSATVTAVGVPDGLVLETLGGELRLVGTPTTSGPVVMAITVEQAGYNTKTLPVGGAIQP